MALNLIKQESKYLRKESCPKCKSKNNLARYDDGHAHCFTDGCDYYEKANGEVKQIKKKISGLIDGEIKALNKRHITQETCKHFNYKVGTHNGSTVHIATFYNKDDLAVAQHLRFPNKNFSWVGTTKEKLKLFGQTSGRDSRMLVITEGEIDAMSISQLWNNKYSVVSINSGVAGAEKDIKNNIEWIEKFETVVFCFDNDEVGLSSAKKCASLLRPNKAKIAKLPMKDANDMLVAGRGGEVIDAIWQAPVFRPDGIILGEDTWELLKEEDNVSTVQYPFEQLNTKTAGLRLGEIVVFCGGSGIGKSQVCREIAYHLIKNDEPVAYIALEENVKRSIRGLVSLELNKPIHLEDVRKEIPEDKLRKAWEAISSKAMFYDHWGSLESDNLINRIRYLVRGCGCRWVILDHLSIVVSGLENIDERRTIDNTMTALRSLVEELNIGLILVSHLKRPDGNKGHEEGVTTSLSQLRGSHAIAQLSDICIGIERNIQDSENSNYVTVRVLKNRFTGDCGVASILSYNKETGRILDCDNLFMEDNDKQANTG